MGRKQYRITFYDSAEVRLDPLEFAWLLSEHDIEVVGKRDGAPVLIVQAIYGEQIERFMADVNRQSGPLIFRDVEVLTAEGYEPFEAEP